MSSSKFYKFYSKYSVPQLNDMILKHRIGVAKLDPQWYDALIEHIKERSLTEDEKISLKQILETEPNLLIKEPSENNSITTENIFDTQMSNIRKMQRAGSEIKSIGQSLWFLLIGNCLFVFGVIMSGFSVLAYAFFGVIQIIAVIIIISKFYNAGSALESVSEEEI